MGCPRPARPSWRHALRAGGGAGAAYLAAQAVDMRLAANRYDDLVLWGGLITRRPRLQHVLGALIHFGLSVAAAAVYQALQPVLPRWPRWLRGIAFMQVENAVLYPGLVILERIHPETPDGRLPSLLTWRYFWVEAARHAAFGAALGTLTRDVQ